MYTEDDLRATFGTLEEEAPDPDVVLAGLDRVRRRQVIRHRTAGVLAALAVAVGMVAASVVVTNQPDPPADPPPPIAVTPPPERQLQFPFAVDEIPGYQVAYRSLDFAGPSEVWIDADFADFDRYTLTVYPKGRYRSSDAEGGEPVRVKGMPGSYHTEMKCVCSYANPDIEWANVPGVAWEYAPDSWALVQYRLGVRGHLPADVREMSLRIADAVRFDRTAPVPIPFRLGYLPTGLEPAPAAAAELSTVFPTSLHASLHLVDGDRLLVIDAGVLLGAQVANRPVGDLLVIDDKDPQALPAVWIVLGQIGVQVSGRGYSVGELEKVARSATAVADVYDLTRWFVADEVLPLD